LNIGDGSLQETKYFLLLARDLGYLAGEQYEALLQLAEKTGALLGGLKRHLKRQMERNDTPER